MATWREERAAQRRQGEAAAAERRRQDEAAAAERRRQDAIAAAEVQAIQQRTQIEVRQAEDKHADQRRAAQRKEQRAERDRARARREAQWKKLREWAASHMVDLMIYPLAIVSAVMAIPAMAHFGEKVYNAGTGRVLPVITELGMWAFAFAVEYSRHKHPERPVWALQLGVLTFTAVGGTLNYLDGATAKGGTVGNGIVMAVVSIAGVVAHQLVKASPRRSRAERDHAKVTRHAAKKIAAVRKAVIDASVNRVDDAGGVVLLFPAGDYLLSDKGVLDLIEPVGDTTVDDMDRQLENLLRNPIGPPKGDSISTSIAPPSGASIPTAPTPPILTPIATPPIDRDSSDDQPGSTPTGGPDRPTGSTLRGARDRGRRARRDRGAGRSTQSRSIEELRADLRAAIADPTIDVNPDSAESIRRTLNCSPKRARELRDNPNG